ncbi:hypothetical protein ACFQS1_16040 [Paractinoplanes rhizophilus]|uniref:Uncharacterized protein n=1 Tax=Paractinoplanes rhizophilus TaxID=1416877 RepID=A0ABW2HQV3_9ACTN
MSMLQLLGGVAAAGVVAAGTTALTGTGVSWGGNGTGQATQYVGGRLTQTVSGGASITAVDYATNTVGDQVTSISVSVTGATGGYLTVTPAGGVLSGADLWSCTSAGIQATATDATGPKVKITASPATVVCATWDSNTSGNAGYYSGLNAVQLDVTNS